MAVSSQERLLDLIRSAGVFRSRDLEDQGFTREHLRRLHARGLVEQVGRGLYRAPDAEISENQALAEAGRRFLMESSACSPRSGFTG